MRRRNPAGEAVPARRTGADPPLQTLSPAPALRGQFLSPAMIRTEVTRRLRGELVGAVVANELMDRERQRKWICMIEKRAGKETLTEVQIETKDN